MVRVVALQAAAASTVALCAALIAGQPAAVSALLGGLACVLPNMLFALHLTLQSRLFSPQSRDAAARATWIAVGLLAGELFKVVLTVALLLLAARLYPQMIWPALIASIIAALLVQPAAHFWRRS